MSCVNTETKLFIETSKRLNLDKGTLESIVHEYINNGNNDFPSDLYILSKIDGNSMKSASEAQRELWELKYSTPTIVDTAEEADKLIKEASMFFALESIKSYKTNEGKYKVTVAEPYTAEYISETRGDNIYMEDIIDLDYSKGRDSRLETLFKSGKEESRGVVETSIVSIINMIEDSQYSSIIELLKTKFGNKEEKLLKGLKVKLINPFSFAHAYEDTGFKAFGFAGKRAFYNASDKTIYVNVVADYNEGNSSGVLLHEIMHAITVDRIISNPEAKAKFEQILKDYQNSNFDPRYREGEVHRLEEFIANIWSDPVTIENLKRIKSTRVKQSLWDEIKEFFNNLFSGIFKGTTSDSLMAEASVEMIKLLESPIIVQSKETFRENLVVKTSTREDVIEEIRQPSNEFFNKSSQNVITQIDNLYNSSIISDTEVNHIAEQVVYWISDHITELQENPDKAIQIYGERLKDKDFSTMDRKDVVKTIGPDNVIAMCKEKFSPENNTDNPAFEDDLVVDQAIVITDNWDAIITLAKDTFLNVEGFAITTIDNSGIVSINDNVDVDTDNFNESNDSASIEEMQGSLQEHYQIESRTLDVMDKMSKKVKQALLKCYILDSNKEPITSKFGIKERMSARDATYSILRWTQGAVTLKDMINKLKEKEESNSWVSQIIERLEDTSGEEADFQSLFFSDMLRHYQAYSIVKVEKGEYISIPVNSNPALTEAVKQITVQYKIGEHPMFTNKGVNKTAFTKLKEAFNSLERFKHSEYDLSKDIFKKEASETLGFISNLLGYSVIPDIVYSGLNAETFNSMYKALRFIVMNLENNLNNIEYNPFDFKATDSILGNIKEFLKPITEYFEDTAISSFFEDGKMYQSYITPSYLTKLFKKFSLEGKAFEDFIKEEYGKFSWFNTNGEISRKSSWRLPWLAELSTDSKAREIFAHKVQLNFDKSTYMKTMSDSEYILAMLTEYFSGNEDNKQSRVPAWFRVPILSNKPSSEYIKFYSERGFDYQDVIVDGMLKIFQQELSRIQTVLLRNYSKSDSRHIKNFDTVGRKFVLLDFMNGYLSDDKSELGKLINSKIQGNKVDEAELDTLAKKAIKSNMNKRVTDTIADWINKGILEGAKKIENVGVTVEEIENNLVNFIWNDAFASMNILELTITDPAFYANAEDLQKRYSQIHSPGIRGNIYATDYQGNLVSDGKERTVILKDFDTFRSNIIANLEIVFDRKIKEAPEDLKAGMIALKESIIEQYNNINVADAQGYNSPISYRKKAFIFGRWSKQAEAVYNRLREGKFNYSDLETAFQPLKPFVYSKTEKESGVNGPLKNLSVPMQNKNSEYLLIMTDALLQGEDTGIPNLLRVIYEVMEESHYDEDGNYKVNGIDTIQFESAVKSGLSGVIDLNEFTSINLSKFKSAKQGEAMAKAKLEACIYKTVPTNYQVQNESGETETRTINTKTDTYNNTFVHELSFEDYCLQQEIPAHFRYHEQIQGSQERYIIPSELATADSNGNPVYYTVEGKKLTAEELKAEYETTIADNIEHSIQELSKELCLDGYSVKERNIALSKILQKEILSSSRYGVDMLIACSLDEDGKFRIPLGDPIQSKRIEQLINSVIKNRVNKQEVAGGPAVQVSNFGTSRDLSIVFKDKEGNLLKTRKEFEGTDSEYKEYIQEHQGGIAYFEVFAPIYTKEMFQQFADKNGVINIKAIEALDPDVLKMIGYRIPTEAKYSISPLKIVGFLPREAGDGIMLPKDITVINGSDFDIDKMYLMLKSLIITKNKMSRSNITKILYDDLMTSQKSKLKYEAKSQLNELIQEFLSDPFDEKGLTDHITAKGYMSIPKGAYKKLLRTYVTNVYKVNKPEEGRVYRNNKIFDMTYEVLTHETSVAEMLNPGGFELQKKMTYAIQAYRNPSNTYTFDQLLKMSVKELKDMSKTDKNLCFIDTHIQFYKQNASAATLIGIFAVNRTAHAVLENEGYKVDVYNACGISTDFTIAGMTFGRTMPIDVRYDRSGESVGKVLGSLVAASADAGKENALDPLNININTANIANTLIRLGMPFEDVALFLSQKTITKIIEKYNTENIVNNVSFNKIIFDSIQELKKKYDIKEDSVINSEELTREELITGLTTEEDNIKYKVLNCLMNIINISESLRMPTMATRFNSMSSAVGPLVIDNLMTEYEMMKLSKESNILDKEGRSISMEDIFIAHPILNMFRRTLTIARTLFVNMPANSNGFRNILDRASRGYLGNVLLNDRGLLNNLSDFYQSYLLLAGGVVDSAELPKFILDFPKEFIKSNYKNKYEDNFLIQSIKYGTDKKSRTTLQLDITGLNNEAITKLKSAWTDLHKTDPDLSIKLFKYCFFRAGIGFNPKAFMNLVPVYVKERIPKYVDTFIKIPQTDPNTVLDQFVRNFWENNKLVPLYKGPFKKVEGGNVEIYKAKDVQSFEDIKYIKKSLGNGEYKLYKQIANKEVSLVYREITALGSNKDYLEINPNGISTPLDITKVINEEPNPADLKPIHQPNTPIESSLDRSDLLELAHKAYEAISKSRKIAEDNVKAFRENYRKSPDKNKEVLEKSIKNFLKVQFDKLKLSYSENLIDDVFKELC